MFVYTGISRRSLYGSRTSARLWHDLGGSLALMVLRLPRRRSTFSRLHRQLCHPLLLLRRPLHLQSLSLTSPTLYPKDHIPTAHLLINCHLDLNVLVLPTLRFSPNTVFRSLLSHTILISLSWSRFGPKCPRLAVFPLCSRICASLASEAIGLFILRISGGTSPHRLRSLRCPHQTSALILVPPPGAACS